MSVHSSGKSYGAPLEVRWREPLTGRNRSRRFEDPEEAARVDRAIQAALALDRALAAWEGIAQDDRVTARAALADV